MTETQENGKFHGLWRGMSASGREKYSGAISIGGIEYWLNLYPNIRKREDKHPDFTFNLVPKR